MASESENRVSLNARRVSVSAAIFVLICFFLPWVEVSCGGAKDSASGFDLAREGDGELWLIPLFMLAFITLGVTQLWQKLPAVFALLGVVGGAFSAYLMNYERTNAEQNIGAHATGWLWLGIFLSLILVAFAFLFFFKRAKSP